MPQYSAYTLNENTPTGSKGRKSMTCAMESDRLRKEKQTEED